MNKKIRYSIALFILISVLGSGANANAALFNWLYKDSGSSFVIGSGSSIDKMLGNMSKKETVSDIEEPEDHAFRNWEDNENMPAPPLNKFSSAPAKRTFTVMATAYSSTPDQTDDTPFVTARNTRVRDGIAAANFLPFGTEFRIPDIYGDKIFIVEDRMNRRYWHRVDIWFPEREMALEFGIKTIRIEIVS